MAADPSQATPRHINDQVYGMIDIPPYAMRVVATAQFQRLHRVRQLGNLIRAWPSAVHTRFSHSIGTMHLAEDIGRRLEFTPKESQVFVLAALLHDIGHGPYSHAFETAIEGNECMAREFKTHDDYRCRLLVEDAELSAAVTPHRDAIISIWNDRIEGDPELPINMIHILHALIAGCAGVDRLDYILRDMTWTTPQRRIDRTCIQSIIRETKIDRDRGVVVYTADGHHFIKQLLAEREYLYREVYSHARAVSADRMLAEAMREGLADKVCPLVASVDRFIQLDDTFVVQQAFNPELPERARAVLLDLIRGRIPRVEDGGDRTANKCLELDIVHCVFEDQGPKVL